MSGWKGIERESVHAFNNELMKKYGKRINASI